MKTNAYYCTPTENPEEPARHSVVVTTEHALSSYGQPVVIEGGESVPAQNFQRPLFLYFKDATDEAKDLVAKANHLAGFGDGKTVAEEREEFAHFFND